MPFFRAKPTRIEAEQFREGAVAQQARGVCNGMCLDGAWRKAHVHTIHNNQAVVLEDGDWVVPEPDGVHFYPIKPEIFAARYEPEC
jgi:hypothetical protein